MEVKIQRKKIQTMSIKYKSLVENVVHVTIELSK